MRRLTLAMTIMALSLVLAVVAAACTEEAIKEVPVERIVERAVVKQVPVEKIVDREGSHQRGSRRNRGGAAGG